MPGERQIQDVSNSGANLRREYTFGAVDNSWGNADEKQQLAAWLIANPEFDFRPATIEEFLGPGYLDIDPAKNKHLPRGVGIRPGVKQALVDIFGDQIDPKNISVMREGMFSGGIGVGKLQRWDDIVLTPANGWVKFSDLSVGDKVIGKNGKSTTVLGMYPHENIQMYRVHFKDGTWLDTGDEHLWEVGVRTAVGVKHPDGRYKSQWQFPKQVVSTEWLYGQDLIYGGAYKFRIPLVDPVEYDTTEFVETVDAYTLGLLIANGSMHSGTPKLSCHSGDRDELLTLIKAPGTLTSWDASDGKNGGSLVFRSAVPQARRQWSNPLAAALHDLGLHGVHAREKFIPQPYLFGPIETRLSLLRGLMDGDGSSYAKNRQVFATSSQRLAADAADLVRSLGGYCTVTEFERRGVVEFQVHVNLDDVCPFRLSRKVGNWKPRTNQRPARSIVKVEKLDRADGVCIRVDAEDSLYVTKDFIVTHNTTFASIALAYCVHWVSCLHDPQGYFGLLPGSRIAFMLMSTKDSQAKEVLFGDIKARINTSEWFKKYCMYDKDYRNQLRFPKDIWILPGNSMETTFEGYNVLCTDNETEILTASGWRKYDEIAVGDSVLTLNHETGLSEWQPLQRVNVFDSPGEMVLMEGGEFSSLTTEGHNWATTVRRGIPRRWRKTHNLTVEDTIPIAAASADRPTEAKYTDALVEAVAWFYTEGSRVGSSSAVIYQKHGTHTCDRIRACLTALFGRASERFQSTSSASTGPLWRENVNNSPDSHHGRPKGLSEFRLNRDAGAVLLEHAPAQVPTHEFLAALTQAQLDMFIEVSMLADNRGPDVFAQKDHARAEAFAFAAILAGRSVSIRTQWQPVKRVDGTVDGYEMLLVRMMRKRGTRPVAAARKKGGAAVIKRVPHTGIVWCPTVRNSTWLARRKGSVYFTGNCGIIDEGDSHKVTENKDYAEAGFETIQARIASRFTDPETGKHRGLLIVIGQMKKADGFMSRTKARMEKDEDAHVAFMAIWESIGMEKYVDKQGRPDVFHFDSKRKVIVPPGPAALVQSDDILTIPNAYKKDFDLNPIKALRDHAGIPPNVDDPFIATVDRVEEAQDKWVARYQDPDHNLAGLTVPVSSHASRPRFDDDLRCYDAFKRAIHVDIAYSGSGDALGMAMGHIPELVEIDGELKPYIVFDFILRIKPSGGQQLMLSDFRKLILQLRDEMKYKIALVTLDGFQSVDSMQILQQKRFNTDYLSVDRNKGPYEELREAIYERRIEFPRYLTYLKKGDTEKVNIAQKELLELTDTGKKIDHPAKGSKDCADAMAGVVYALMGSKSFRRGARRINAPDLGADHDGPLSLDAFSTRDLSPESLGQVTGDLRLPTPVRGLPDLPSDPFGALRRAPMPGW